MKFLRKTTKKNKQGKSQIPFRLNFLFFVVFLLFAALIAQLAYLQIINGTRFESEVSSTDTKTETKNVQRGMIYDTTGKVLVANNASRAITYTKSLSVTAMQMYNIANDLVQYVDIETSTLTPSNKADYYLAVPQHLKDVQKRIPGYKKMGDSELYRAAVDYVKRHKLVKDMSQKEKEAAIVYSKMNGAYSLSTVYIKYSGVTDAEMSQVGEHLAAMPGIKVGTSWSRSYPNGESVKSVIGTVTSEKQGLPSDQINSLLAQGYSRDDSVGSSYIESQYENILKGTKSVTTLETQNNKITREIKTYGGKKGDNVVLTINAEFQKKVQDIMKSSVESVGGGNPYLPGAYAVVMNPNTGGIYALAGVSRDLETGKVSENALGAINQSFVMGSVVKGATVMGGLMSGAITPENNTMVDEPIKLQGTATKSSWFNSSGANNMSLSASNALMVSSNSYMMQLAMREGGFKYSSGAALSMPTSVFSKLRGNFNQFGLGVKTGIDIPGESTGYEGPANQANIGKSLDLSFGNYDSYTTIQLAQYISTIANGGYRLQPHVLQSVHGTNKDGTLGQAKAEVSPNVLNVVGANQDQWDVVKTGLWRVVHGSSTYRTGGTMADVKPQIAAKTGTAQTFHGETPTETLSAVSYAPAKNPQVAVALVFPGMADSTTSHVNTQAVASIYSAFWKYVQSSDGLE
ncbi:cell division protein FtsI [Liquorilactobacillus sucicola DSM 21376 = JCM 15457]|uniref:Penicillin-binding protein n=1 Tax=Liquorilactobacillus sucicola DSM 21376 = JCM 15457 TaxID=1423806 RepID=A0A023CTZ2_9LACO|nr:penicillin-binding protein 2 [Liquorilactobacillus sucicola]KRN05201.1 penicillin-binding protein [Liquorilactobacillus sucicola DSM 21376 = JCM 15457]GAJ25257.1 cell division protein FtsI [Liquorilactobacillus sucicola DSM 21376 = JCM 15457]